MASESSSNTTPDSGENPINGATPAHHLLAGILNAFPSYSNAPHNGIAMLPNNTTNGSQHRNDLYFNNFLSSLETPSFEAPFSIGVAPTSSGMRPQKMSSESSNNSSIGCSWCDVTASIRCLECNEFMCNSCVGEHCRSPLSSNHPIVPLPTPIGTSPTGNFSTSAPVAANANYVCDQHNELLRYVCIGCKKLVCQFCTLHEHKEHKYSSIPKFIDDAKDKIQVSLDSCNMGTRCIKTSIDRALNFIRQIERNCAELSENIRKSFRQFVIAIEDRERFLLEFVEKLRQRRLAMLHDQMAGLKSALAGLAETSELLQKVVNNGNRMDQIEIAMKVTSGERQMEQFAYIYKDLQPRQESYAFAPPDYNLLQDIRNQGGIVLVDDKNMPLFNISGGSIVGGTPAIEPMGAVMPGISAAMGNGMMPANMRRPLLRDNSFRNPSPVVPIRGAITCGGMPSSVPDWNMPPNMSLHVGTTPAIPGTIDLVQARNSNVLSLSFATEGHEDGQVSRPWGLCADKMGHILVSDRRNNRVQVFNPDGSLRFKFGRKGAGNGEFDLPAGICVDIDNRIIVVDKDNHRVQIFTSSGVFLLKFGSYGKEYGQFQYPWDVAVNARRQIVVTDSRNHRIQQFDSEGRFIRQIVFDNHGSNKGIASPRGVCYTPTGNIIVSDFDNHCLYLIDPDRNEILASKGHEGCGFQEFNRPSGLCCDDDGRIIVADSKNQRILVFSPVLDYLWDIEIRPSMNPAMPHTLDEKDRTCDVALMPDGRIVFLIELSPDSKEGSNPFKRFVHIF